MLVDRCPQVVHHALADLVREQRLDDAEDAGPDRNRDHRADEDVEQAQIAVGQRVVEDPLDEERRNRAHGRGEEDQAEDAGETEPVGPKEADDPAQVRAANRLVCGALDRL